MSAYYGTMKGGRKAVTCTGTKNSGIQVAAQSWGGSVQVSMYEGSDGQTMVSITTGEGSTAYGSNQVFRGTLADLAKLKLTK